MNDDRYVSLEEAASILNVSEEYVSRLTAQGKLLRIARTDGPAVVRAELVAYKADDDAYREAIADELTQLSQDMGLYRSRGETL